MGGEVGRLMMVGGAVQRLLFFCTGVYVRKRLLHLSHHPLSEYGCRTGGMVLSGSSLFRMGA